MYTCTFTAELWRWQARADGWFFVTVPAEASDEIDEQTAAVSHGFGSVPVAITIGRTSWTTSVFPDTSRGAYVLPIKKAVRTAEGLAEGDHVGVTLTLR